MSFKTKNHVTDHKAFAERKLSERMELLKTRGLDEAGIQKDSFVKKVKAQIRKTNRQLRNLAGQEKLAAERVRAKADKLAAKKEESRPPAPAAPAPKPKKQKPAKAS